VAPGEAWAYSNTGYLVLTEVLSRVLGGPGGIEEAWRSMVGDVPGDDQLTLDRSAVSLDRLAHGYGEQPDGTFRDPYAAYQPSGVPTDLFGLPFGDGLFAGTAVGTALFLDALFVGGRLLQTATVDLMTTATPQAAAGDDPQQSTYGMGTFEAQAAGGRWQGHRGRYAGFSTMGASERDSGLTLVVLCNGLTEAIPAVQVWEALARATAGGAGG
jgi:D-alanyl-D-alanine carboxypeptidase